MKKPIFVLSMLFFSGNAWAVQDGPLTCWYDAYGENTGAESGNLADIPEAGQYQSYGSYDSDYAFAYRIDDWNDGDDCPQSINLSDE